MRYLAGVLLAFVAGGRVFAQEGGGRCSKPDSIVVTGNTRVDEPTIRASMGILAGAPLNARQLQEGVKALFGTGQFDDVQISCTVAANNKTVLAVTVKERQVLGNVTVVGPQRVSKKSVRDKIDLGAGKPIDPGQVSKAVTRIDSLYESTGYYLAKVNVDTSTGKNNSIDLTFRVDEGHRLAVSGIAVHGATKLTPKEVVAAMKTKPEGFALLAQGRIRRRQVRRRPGGAHPRSLCERRLHRFPDRQGHAPRRPFARQGVDRHDRERGQAVPRRLVRRDRQPPLLDRRDRPLLPVPPHRPDVHAELGATLFLGAQERGERRVQSPTVG